MKTKVDEHKAGLNRIEPYPSGKRNKRQPEIILMPLLYFLSIFLFLFASLSAQAEETFFLTRNNMRIELPQYLQLELKRIVLTEEYRILPQDMPSAFFYPLGRFIINDKEYNFYLFHIQGRETGYYYDVSELFISNAKIRQKLRPLLDARRMLSDDDANNLRKLFNTAQRNGHSNSSYH